MSDEFVSAKAARRAQEEKALRQRKKYNLTVTAVVVCFVLVLIFVAFFSSNLFYNGTTALKIGSQSFTVADFNYNYFTSYNNYYSSIYSQYGSSPELMSMLLPSTGSSFRKQAYMGSEDMTWADFFTNSAIDRMKSLAALLDAARKEGYTLSDEDKAAVDSSVENLRANAVASGYSDLNAYLAMTYGKGMTEKVFRQNVEREYIASTFSQQKSDSFTFTGQEIADNYAENAADYDFYKYRLYSFSGAAVTDDEDTEEDETMTAEEATAKAKADAEAFKAAVTDEQSYMDYVAKLNEDTEGYDADTSTLYTSQGSSITDFIKTWLSDEARKAGDVEVLKTDDDAATTNYYVVMFLERDDNRYNAVSGYYGLCATDEDDEEGIELEGDALTAALKDLTDARAQEVKTAYDALEEKGYDAFVKLMAENSETVSGSGDVSMSGMYDLPEPLAAWFHDEARKEGDVDTVYVEDYGTFVVYFSGVDGVYGDLMSEGYLRQEAYTAWEDEQLKNFDDVDQQWEMTLAKKLTSMGG